jgi:hypothetical protein
MKMDNIRIGIAGNIGVGKSTFIEAASSAPLNKVLTSVYLKPNETKGCWKFAFLIWAKPCPLEYIEGLKV